MANAVYGFSQAGFTSKDLSVNPIYDGAALPGASYTTVYSTTPPTITNTGGSLVVQCAANQTVTYGLTNLTTPAFLPTGDYTIEYRVKVPVYNGGRGFDLYVRDGVNQHAFFCITNERLQSLITSSSTTVASYYLDATRYHTYRYAVTRSTGESDVWIDGVYRGKITTKAATSGVYNFTFGKSSTANIIDFYLDYLTFDLTGAYKPTNTVLEEPALTAKDVSTSPDLDGTVLPDAATPAWTIPTLSGTEYSISSTDGVLYLDCPVNNQYLFQSPVVSSNNLFTLEFKAKVTAATGRGMDIVIGSQLICLNTTSLYNNTDGGSSAPLFEISDNNFHTFRFTGSGTGKYVDVWVDNQYIGVTNVSSATKFQLGKSNSSSATTLYLDYATIDNAGSYKPLLITTQTDLVKSSQTLIVQKQNGSISINGLSNKSSSVKIYNMKGQNVLTVRNYMNLEPIDVSKFDQGVYLIKINEDSDIKALKFIKR